MTQQQTTRQAVLALSPQEASVPVLRHFADDLLRHWGIAQDDRHSAQLIIGELGANVVQHGRADMTMLLTLDETVLRLTVADSGPVVADRAPQPTVPADERGRGMGIVEFLAAWTEVRDSDQGRRVRVEMHVRKPQGHEANSTPLECGHLTRRGRA
ncbi:ATP-binding protein [Streptomyces sp. NPDC098781]|uniref:ATP-binding protein n=1 Tax=Streptomyces sp. NPDC098781 TaxID=3366097 RepID=UPI0037FE03A1